MWRYVGPFIIAVSSLVSRMSDGRAQATNDVLTFHNDIYRSGVYAGEKNLTPTSVGPRRFG